jgi:hypothetical protein
MRQAEPLKEIEGLEKTAQAIMKQIYDCTLFLRSYGERGFISEWVLNNITLHYLSRLLDRTLGNSFTVKTDDAIRQFTGAFTELKTRFRDGLDIDSWKIASTMKDGVVQLVATTDRLKEIGELRVDMKILQFSCSKYS